MEPWNAAQRAFAVKAFSKNGGSFVMAQREFWIEFGIHRNRTVPSAHAIKTWVRNFEATGSTLKKEGGSVKTVHTPDNIAEWHRVATRRMVWTSFNGLYHCCNILRCTYCFYTTTFLL